MKSSFSIGSGIKPSPTHQQYRDRNANSTYAKDLSNTLTDNEDDIDYDANHYNQSSWNSRLDSLELLSSKV